VLSKGLPIVRMAGRSLKMQDIAKTGGGYSTRFDLPVDTWAGRTNLLVSDNVERRAVVLEIGPHEKKLDQNAFDAMLAELANRSQALPWGLAPGAAAGRLATNGPAAVHPAVIESQLPIFERLLTHLVADPPTVTIRLRECRPLDVSRRVDLQTLRWLSRRPQVVASISGDRENARAADPQTPIDQPTPSVSFDHPVTRYIAFLLRRVLARLQDTACTLRNVHSTHPDIDAHARDLAEQTDTAAARVEIILRAPLFRQVRPEPITDTALQSLPDHPLYSALHRVAGRLLSPGLAYGPNERLYTSLKHTYDLFELLVLYRLVDALPRLLGPHWKLKRAAGLNRSRVVERPQDRAAWLIEGPNEFSIELRYQQWFGRARSPPDARLFSSLSGLNIPDFILLLRQQAQPISWLILDAKYRSGRQAVDQGLGDVHRYRDALRVAGLPAAGAYVVVPRLQEVMAPYSRSEYHVAHNFGVLQVYSDVSWLQPVEQWIESALRSAEGDEGHEIT
jgi:hypothetical protein